MNKYRTGFQRFVASTIDGFILIPLALLDFWIVTPGRPAPLLVAWLLVSYPAGWVYSVLMHGLYGQTIGKMITGVKVLDVSEVRRISMRQSVMRDSIYILINTAALATSVYLVVTGASVDSDSFIMTGAMVGIAALAWSAAEILTLLTNKKRRALHDLIAGTVVLKIEVVPVEIDEV